MRVSIIIPVYNSEKYVSRCIESCLRQTLSGVEIILIDDRSTDSSRDIIKTYSEKHPDKVRYFFQETNQRQGAARNRGMGIARGDYFIFVDSDDWIEPDMCEKLYNKARETDADMVGSDYYNSWNDRNELKKVEILPGMCGDMDIAKKREYIKHYGMFWTRIYKRSFLRRVGLEFPENTFYEDAFFNFYSVLYADKIEHIDEAMYHYYQGNQSTVRNRNNPRQYERISLAEYILDYGRSHAELAQYEDIIEYKYLHMQGSNLIYTCLALFDEPDKSKMKSISNAVSKRKAELRQNRTYKSLPDEFRVFMWLNKISPSLCVFVYRQGIWSRIEAVLRRLRIR